jgi:hypothetical protein
LPNKARSANREFARSTTIASEYGLLPARDIERE